MSVLIWQMEQVETRENDRRPQARNGPSSKVPANHHPDLHLDLMILKAFSNLDDSMIL